MISEKIQLEYIRYLESEVEAVEINFGQNYYQILEIDTNSSFEEISNLKKLNTSINSIKDNAFAVLLNPESRKIYDSWIDDSYNSMEEQLGLKNQDICSSLSNFLKFYEEQERVLSYNTLDELKAIDKEIDYPVGMTYIPLTQIRTIVQSIGESKSNYDQRVAENLLARVIFNQSFCNTYYQVLDYLESISPNDPLNKKLASTTIYDKNHLELRLVQFTYIQKLGTYNIRYAYQED